MFSQFLWSLLCMAFIWIRIWVINKFRYTIDTLLWHTILSHSFCYPCLLHCVFAILISWRLAQGTYYVRLNTLFVFICLLGCGRLCLLVTSFARTVFPRGVCWSKTRGESIEFFLLKKYFLASVHLEGVFFIET